MDTHPHRIRVAHCMLMAALCSMEPLALAGDMSRLSDFDFPSAYITQNEAWITQDGNRNTASIDQGSDAGMNDRGQYTDITQTGDDNKATVLQVGGQNGVKISQDGVGNSVDLVQTGDGNRFSGKQTGNANSINGNGINPNATDEAHAFDSSVGPVIQRGLRNSMDIVQNNDGNSLSAIQIGNDNVIIFTQNGGNAALLSEIGDRNTISLTQNQGVLAVKNVALIGNDMRVTVTAN